MAVAHPRHVVLLATLGLALCCGAAGAAESNLLANGGFEMTGRLAPQMLQRHPKHGLRFENDDPLLPMRWTWSASGSPELRLVGDAHTGGRALRVTVPKGSSATLSMSLIEVGPGATYAFWRVVKGQRPRGHHCPRQCLRGIQGVGP